MRKGRFLLRQPAGPGPCTRAGLEAGREVVQPCADDGYGTGGGLGDSRSLVTAGLTLDKRAELLTSIPLGRIGAADEVADTVAFLAGPEAAYITGQVIRVNGGLLM